MKNVLNEPKIVIPPPLYISTSGFKAKGEIITIINLMSEASKSYVKIVYLWRFYICACANYIVQRVFKIPKYINKTKCETDKNIKENMFCILVANLCKAESAPIVMSVPQKSLSILPT